MNVKTRKNTSIKPANSTATLSSFSAQLSNVHVNAVEKKLQQNHKT